MSGRLQGKTALVTGATSNIGRAIAVAFAAEGATVAVSGRSRIRGESVIARIVESGGRAAFVTADLDGTAATSSRLADDAAAAVGADIDILVNNAAIFPGSNTADTDEATFDRVFAVNVKSPFYLTATIAPTMAARGSGAIINLSSWIVRLGIPVGSLYSATKGAIDTLTRSWAAEYGPSGVRVNAISPGVVVEDLAAIGDNPNLAFMRGTPANTLGTADQIASAAIYLASDEASFVHGAVIDVDGGRTATAVIAV